MRDGSNALVSNLHPQSYPSVRELKCAFQCKIISAQEKLFPSVTNFVFFKEETLVPLVS